MEGKNCANCIHWREMGGTPGSGTCSMQSSDVQGQQVDGAVVTALAVSDSGRSGAETRTSAVHYCSMHEEAGE